MPGPVSVTLTLKWPLTAAVTRTGIRLTGATATYERAKRSIRAKQGDNERCTETRVDYSLAQRVARALCKIRNLQRLTLGNRFG